MTLYNASGHCAKSVKNWLQTQPFQTMKQLVQSPNINLIENVWAYLKMKLGNKYSFPPTTITDLWQRVQEQEWYSITPEYCENVALNNIYIHTYLRVYLYTTTYLFIF